MTKRSNKETYDKTINRENIIRSKGYKLVTIWEHEWNKMNKNKLNINNDIDKDLLTFELNLKMNKTDLQYRKIINEMN